MINGIVNLWLKGLRNEIAKDLMYEALLWIGLVNLWLIGRI